jgi:hypothetical protein
MAPSDSNDNNNNNDKNPHQLDKQMQEHVKQRKAEMMLFDRFKKIATSKLESMTRQSKESGVPYQMGEQEKQVLRDMQGMGIKEGIAATVVAFLVLRKGPIYISRYIHKRRMMAQRQQSQPPPQQQQQPPGSAPPSGNNGGGYQLSNPSNKLALPTNNSKHNPFQKAKETTGVPPRSRNPVLGFIWFTIDSMLSLMVGASVSMAYTDMDKIRQQLLESPLLPGRSLVADALCEDIVRELQAIQQTPSDKDHPAYQRLVKQLHHHHHSNNNTSAAASAAAAKSPASYYLEGIIAFSENCQRRQFVERRLRQEQGLMDQNEAVEIPDPIPRDGPRLVLVDNGSGEEGGGEDMVIEGNDDFNEFHKEDIDWASDFVKDFEEARRK